MNIKKYLKICFLIASCLNNYAISSQKLDYINGNGFRACADYFVEDGTHNFNARKVPAGSTIYVETHELAYFFREVFPHLPGPIKLISHNSDFSAPAEFVKYLDDPKIMVWFSQNPDIKSHPKFHPLPIGIANYKWEHGRTEIFDQVIAQISTTKPDQKPQLYINFSVATNPIRGKLHQLFKGQALAKFADHKSPLAHLQEMSQYQFVLSPFGNGLDCHRTWEALLVGAIPVVQTSTLDPLYENLPVIIVQDWEEITAEFLTRKAQELSTKPMQRDKLFMPYWIEFIKTYSGPK